MSKPLKARTNRHAENAKTKLTEDNIQKQVKASSESPFAEQNK